MINVEELIWDQTVYATTNYSYNLLDKLTGINQAGQTRTFGYDGYGRLQSRTTPEQGTTTYSYFADNTAHVVTDARGATATFAYNNRKLVTGITYGVTGAVAATANVSFGYDAAGNRTSMTDGLGSISYVYNTTSQLTSETRTFTGVPGSYMLSYGYNLGGQLNSITNPWGAVVGYGYDKTGRASNVSGSGYAGVSSYVSSMAYRTFGLKQLNYSNGRTLSVQYDNRMRPTQWNIPSVMGWNYGYNYFGENTGRVTYAQNLNDATLDRSYYYDHVSRLQSAFTGSAARAHVGVGSSWLSDGPYAAHDYVYDVWGNTLSRTGWGGANPQYGASYTNNKMNTVTYDAAGNLTDAGGGWTFTYNATGQQAYSAVGNLQMFYDGDRLRGKKSENGVLTYYLRSTMLGGQVVAEMTSAGGWSRGYVYLNGEILAVQYGGVYWMHQDPVAKSKRITNSSGTVVSTIELDPWGGETNRSSNEAFQPRKFTTYERDSISSDDAMHRRYNRWWSRFEQPDPYDGSYNLADPQSFNRYSYVQNDPVNFRDPSGLMPCGVEFSFSDCGGGGGFWGGSRGFGGHIGAYNREYGGLSPRVAEGMAGHDQRLQNTLDALAADRALQQALETNDLTDWERVLELLEANDTLAVTSSHPNPLGFFLLAQTGGGEPTATPAVGGILLRILVGIGARIVARKAVVSAGAIIFGHGARHLANSGLSQRVVELAIRTQVQNAVANASVSGSFWGRVVVNGTTIEYRAHTLANGTINIGTYYPIP